MQNPTPDLPMLEETVLASWKEHGTFERIQNERRSAERFVFWEGPPYANGRPGIHHVLARAYKDAIARYQTMRGKFVDRKAGWDTHGLPTELDVEKKLGVKTKRDIEEKIGVERFVEECRRTAFGHVEEWRKLTERMAYWVDLDHPYVTDTNDYIESVWWVLSQAWQRKLLEQDFKVVPWCTRCGTALSSHELAQGYKESPDPSVVLQFELKKEKNTYFLVWTTTPWTLPGNVALALGADISYVKVQPADGPLTARQYFWIAESRMNVPELRGLLMKGKIVERKKGRELNKVQYMPLFSDINLSKRPGDAYYTIAVEPEGGNDQIVSDQEGTGIVHTAVMYGEDDFLLGKKHHLPQIHTVDEDGRFNKLVPKWTGRYVKEDGLGAEIQDSLGIKVKSWVSLSHEYPHCWRCGTPVLYYAKTTWFIRMLKLRKQLLAANATVNWVPAYIKDGRFGEWLREVKDWAVARDRYWGVPLPIWTCDHCGEHEFVANYSELRKKAPSRNRYWTVRHGEAGINTLDQLNSDIHRSDDAVHLSTGGRMSAKEAGKKLKKEKIDVVVTSPFPRARETAEAIARATGAELVVEDRFREWNMGPKLEGKTVAELRAWYVQEVRRFTVAPPGGETWNDVCARIVATVRDLDARYDGRRIAIVSHRDPLLMLRWAASGSDDPEDALAAPRPEYGVPDPLEFRALAFNAAGRFDPHRPYLDAVTWKCSKCGKGTMHRVPEVADVWLDSGSMPFAQWHYPFENKSKVDAGEAFPADFIAEGIDQTRGWFYVLLAVSVLTGRGAPYRNVVSLGLVNDAEGRKMSKSVGNIVDPWTEFHRVGADAVRWYLATVSTPGDFKRYDPKGVGEVVRKVFFILSNTVTFWETYGAPGEGGAVDPSGQLLDRWLTARTAEAVVEATNHLDGYDLAGAGRAVAAFVTDLSTWYTRRSRDRFKGDGAPAATRALHEALAVAVKLVAPLAPMTADALWARLHHLPVADVGGHSVHREAWPEAAQPDARVLEGMEAVRRIAETAHALRRARDLKVRQPLSQLVVSGVKLSDGAAEILADELNVQEVVMGKAPTTAEWERADAGGLTVALDSTVTDELKELGMVRETVRAINQLRKSQGMAPTERPALVVASANAELVRFAEHYRVKLVQGGRLAALSVGELGPSNHPAEQVELPGGTLELNLQ